jgi:hypothetical protein
VKSRVLIGALLLVATPAAIAQAGDLTVPRTVTAGSAFSLECNGNGDATLYIVGQGLVIKRALHLDGTERISLEAITAAGHYIAILVQPSSTENSAFDVVPAAAPAQLSFFARPSRLPVDLHHGISGAVYVFDAYGNLIVAPQPVSFALSTPSGATQTDVVTSRDGAAWTLMDSTGRQGKDTFVAHTGAVSSKRVVTQVPGDPCSLKMTAEPAGGQLQLKTDPVRDCSGNAVPDGTVVTFTEAYQGSMSTADVPLKQDFAEVKMPMHSGATLSVASGVMLGNQIHWEQ